MHVSKEPSIRVLVVPSPSKKIITEIQRHGRHQMEAGYSFVSNFHLWMAKDLDD